MRTAAFASLLLSALPSAAIGQADQYSGIYLCIEEMVAGLRFNESQEQWTASTFRPTDRFVVNVDFVQPETLELDGANQTWTYGIYSATISLLGDEYVATCYGHGRSPNTEIPVYNDGLLACRAGLKEYQIGLQSMRYISSYMIGYVGGQDANTDNPAVMGGTCTKIQ